MNELALKEKDPLYEEWLKKRALLENITSFSDVKLHLMQGEGLAAGSYNTYLVAVRGLYELTDGLHPLQIHEGHIEAYFDRMLEHGLSRNTAVNRIMGLKAFFRSLETKFPGLTDNPFEHMPDKLKNKLSRGKKPKTKKTFTQVEVKKLLDWMKNFKTVEGKRNYAIVYMFLTSGLRVSELLSLRWKDLEFNEGKWTAYFKGKGDTGMNSEQELFTDAVEATKQWFKAWKKRKPRTDEYLFYTLPVYTAYEHQPMYQTALFYTLKALGKAAGEAGIITRDINWSCHLFRRSYATLLYKNGMKVKALQRLTRHRSAETLLQHYIQDEEPASPIFAKVLT